MGERGKGGLRVNSIANKRKKEKGSRGSCYQQGVWSCVYLRKTFKLAVKRDDERGEILYNLAKIFLENIRLESRIAFKQIYL